MISLLFNEVGTMGNRKKLIADPEESIDQWSKAMNLKSKDTASATSVINSPLF